MIADQPAACDEMLALFWAAWGAADWTTLVGSTTPARVEWDGLDDGTLRDASQPFAAVAIRHTANPQATFRGPGGRRYTATGRITTQVFAPISLRNGSTMAQKLAIIAQGAFQGRVSPGGVWFPNVVAKEVGADGLGYYQINVVANFSYDTLA